MLRGGAGRVARLARVVLRQRLQRKGAEGLGAESTEDLRGLLDGLQLRQPLAHLKQRARTLDREGKTLRQHQALAPAPLGRGLSAVQPVGRALQAQGLRQPAGLMARTAHGLVGITRGLAPRRGSRLELRHFGLGQAAGGHRREQLHLVERLAELLARHDLQGLAQDRRGFIELALQHQTLGLQRHLVQEVVPGGDLRRHRRALAQVGHRLVQRPGGQLDVAARLEAPAGELRVCRVLPGARELMADGQRLHQVATEIDDEDTHDGGTTPAVQVARLAVQRGRLGEVRIGRIPLAFVVVEKTPGVPGEGDGRGVVGLLRDDAGGVVVAAREPEQVEGHEAEGDAAQATRFGHGVAAVLAGVELEQAVEQHAFLVEEVVHPRHRVADGGNLLRRFELELARHRQSEPRTQLAPEVRRKVLDDGAQQAAARARVVQAQLRQRTAKLLQRLLVVPRAVQRRAKLARQRRALQRAESVAEGLHIGGFGLAEVLQRFGVGRHAAGLVTGLEEVLLRLVPVFGARVVVRQQAGEFFEPAFEECLDGLRHAAMDELARLGQHAAVGGFVHQSVLEDVFDLRHMLAFADELGMFEFGHARRQCVARGADDFEHAVEEAAANDRGQLQRLLHLFVEPVDARQDQALHGVGQVHLFDLFHQLPAVVARAAHQHTVGHQRADHFFDEEGVAFGLAQDLLAQRRGQLGRAHEVGHQRGALCVAQGRERDLAELRAAVRMCQLADACGRAFGVGPRREERKQGLVLDQRQQVLGQFDRGLVGPMPVFEQHHHRLALRELFEQLAHAHEDLAPQPLAVEVLHAFGVFARNAQRQHRGQVGQHLLSALAEERVQASGELAPALVFAVVFADVEAALQDFNEGPVAQAAAERHGAAF